MTRKLIGYAGVGQQNSTGVFQDTGGDDTFAGAVPMEDAAEKANDGTDPEGLKFYIQVRLADQTIVANRDYYEYMIATYGLSGGVYTWTRVETLQSSAAGASINWDAISSDANSLRFTSVAGPQLKSSYKWSTTDYSTTSTSNVAMSDTYTVKPTTGQTELILSSYGYMRANSATNDTRSFIEFQHKNSSGVFQSSTFGAFIGYLNIAADGTAQSYDTGTIKTVLNQSHLNSSGEWEFRIDGNVLNSNITLESFNVLIDYTEGEPE